jgi:hypothetical protein
MSTIVPEEELGISLQKLRQMIATSETFQAGVQGGYGDAVERVYFGRQSGQLTRPFVLLLSDAMGSQLIAGGSMNHLRLNGQVKMHIEIDADTDLDSTDQESAAMDFVQGVLGDVQSLAAVDDTVGDYNESHLPIVSTSLDTFGKNETKFWNSMGQFFVCTASINWGDG